MKKIVLIELLLCLFILGGCNKEESLNIESKSNETTNTYINKNEDEDVVIVYTDEDGDVVEIYDAKTIDENQLIIKQNITTDKLLTEITKMAHVKTPIDQLTLNINTEDVINIINDNELNINISIIEKYIRIFNQNTKSPNEIFDFIIIKLNENTEFTANINDEFKSYLQKYYSSLFPMLKKTPLEITTINNKNYILIISSNLSSQNEEDILNDLLLKYYL